MMLEERTVLYEAIRRKGRRAVTEEAAIALEHLAVKMRSLVDLIDKSDPGAPEIHEEWTRAEWALADASIALDELEYIYCDDPIQRKRATLLRGKAAGYGLIGGDQE